MLNSRNITDLNPKVANLAREFIDTCAMQNIQILQG